MTDQGSFQTNVMLDFITGAIGASTKEEIMGGLAQASKDFGFDSFAISGIPLPHERIDPYFILNGWPQAWFQRYVDQNFVHIDPVIYETKISNDAFVWSEALKDKRLESTARRVMNEATEFDMRDGFSVPLHGVSGFQAIVTYGAPKIDLSPEARGTIHIISIYAHNRIRALLSKQQKSSPKRITKREQEVLLWCAAGKTNWEIGQILSLSAKTIQHELATLQRKLDAVNRAQLIAEAFRLGIIH